MKVMADRAAGHWYYTHDDDMSHLGNDGLSRYTCVARDLTETEAVELVEKNDKVTALQKSMKYWNDYYGIQ